LKGRARNYALLGIGLLRRRFKRNRRVVEESKDESRGREKETKKRSQEITREEWTYPKTDLQQSPPLPKTA